MAAFKRKEYPPNWKELRSATLKRANYQCERCGVKDRAEGARDRHGVWHDEADIHSLNSDVGFSLFGDFPKIIRIVLTSHHTCRDKGCDNLSHLESLCQKCHLTEEQAIAQEARRKRKEADSPCLPGF
jgi:5-methylcytosine-specific restriction endonuclease McrA